MNLVLCTFNFTNKQNYDVLSAEHGIQRLDSTIVYRCTRYTPKVESFIKTNEDNARKH